MLILQRRIGESLIVGEHIELAVLGVKAIKCALVSRRRTTSPYSGKN